MSRQSGDSGLLLNILYNELIVFSVIIAVTDLMNARCEGGFPRGFRQGRIAYLLALLWREWMLLSYNR